MNIAYTHRFTDEPAKEAAAVQNLEHMMFLFWWDNAPQVVRALRQPFIDDTTEAIEDWVADHPTPTVVEISDFLSRLVTDTQEMVKDNDR